MTGLVFASIAERSGALVILDAGRRTYAGLSHDRTYWHLIQPTRSEAGQLTCTCLGGAFHRSCWRIDQAMAFETGERNAVAWMPPARDVAPETELERAAARG